MRRAAVNTLGTYSWPYSFFPSYHYFNGFRYTEDSGKGGWSSSKSFPFYVEIKQKTYCFLVWLWERTLACFVSTKADSTHCLLRVPEIVISTPKMLCVAVTYRRLNVAVGCTGSNSFSGGLVQLLHFPPKLHKDLLELQQDTTWAYRPYWKRTGDGTWNSPSAQFTHCYTQTGFKCLFGSLCLTSRHGTKTFSLIISHPTPDIQCCKHYLLCRGGKLHTKKETRQIFLSRACFYCSVWYICLLEAGQSPLESKTMIFPVKPL